MKETIFFNSDQLKVIRRYGIFYRSFFDYGLWIFAFLFSILLSWGVFASGYFSSLPLFDQQSLSNDQQLVKSYQNKQELLKAFPALNALVVHGQLYTNESLLHAQDLFLLLNGLVLPRQVSLSLENMTFFAQKEFRRGADDTYFHRFFTQVLQAPLHEDIFSLQKSLFLPLDTNLKTTFGLDCLDTASQHSFVCHAYTKHFLERFFFYDLNRKTSSSLFVPPESDKEQQILQELSALQEVVKTHGNQHTAFCKGLVRYAQYGGLVHD